MTSNDVVLVTGASGFIGQALVKRLVGEGLQVRAVVRRTSKTEPLEELGVEIARVGLQSVDDLAASLDNVGVVFHLAARTSAPSLSDLLAVNADGTRTLVSACLRQQTPPLFVYVSSVAASGPVRRGCVRLPDDPERPISNYGCSKRAGEIAAIQAAERMPSIIVRPGIVFGPRNLETLPIFQSVSRLRVHAVPGMWAPPLSILHVDDLVEILLRLPEKATRLEAGTSNGIYFACCPEYPNYGELGRMVAQALGRRRPVMLYLPEPLPWVVGFMSEAFGRLRGSMDTLNVDKIRESKAASWACSTRPLEQDLEFRFSSSLLEQLTTTAQWYRSEGWI